MKPSEILDKAQDEIQRRGWCQGAYLDEKGSVCAIGAIRAAAYGRVHLEYDSTTTERRVARRMAESYSRLVLPDGLPELGRSVSGYNDLPTTSAEDVLLMLKRGAERAREEGQ